MIRIADARKSLYSDTMRPFALLIFTSLSIPAAFAQQLSPWQGEWAPLDASGDRLTLSDCTGQSCKFYLFHTGCGTQPGSPLQVQSATDATADLPGADTAHSCQLHLQRTASAKPMIEVKQTGNGCSYYCVSGYGSFETKFVEHSNVVYAGLHAAECLKNPGPATMATCLDPALAALEQQWQDLYSDFPLTPPTKDIAPYQASEKLDTAYLSQCNNAAAPAQCLHDRFLADLAIMNSKKAVFEQGYTERGDVAEAARKGAAIAGRYRHTFDNGDVQGDHYRTTDKLTIKQILRNSIDFDMNLNFFNGHTCSISGGALYRKDGSFVFDDDPANAVPSDPVCHLAIIPTAKGVTFKDLNGGCKMVYCGARGSFNDEGFLFTERIAPKSVKKTPAK